VRTKQCKKIARRDRVQAPSPGRANQCWSMDFVSDKFTEGRSFRVLSIVDQFTRECIALSVDRSMSSAKVAEALTAAVDEYGSAPESITVDNGTEFTGRALEIWTQERSVQVNFIRPGEPVENCYAESFNSRLRDECLNVEWFASLEEARRKIAAWRDHKLTDKAGLRGLRGHDLMHNWVNGHAEIGTPQSVLEAQAGHLSKRMSDRYKHISEKAARKASEELGRVRTEQRAEARARLRERAGATDETDLIDSATITNLGDGVSSQSAVVN
jgi:hypothetical protein